MPRPHTDNPAVRESFSIRLEHQARIARLVEWLGVNKSIVAQRALDCLYEAEAPKHPEA
jgi:hypothetical protein